MPASQKSGAADKQPSKTPTTTIKIAAKEASQRKSAGAADPGPGDPSAAPSEAPQLVDLPNPPTPSELVVKSTSSMKQGRSSPKSSAGASGYKSTGAHSKSKSKLEGSVAGPAASNPSIGGGAPREPTSSQPLTGPTGPISDANGSTASEHHSKSHHSTSAARGSAKSAGAKSHKSSAGGSQVSGSGMSPAAGSGVGGSGSQMSPSQSPAANTASAAMQADSGAVHDEDEVGEGEVEQPETPASPASSAASGAGGSTGPGGSAVGVSSGLLGTSQPDGPSAVSGADGSGVQPSQASVSGGPKSGGVSGSAASIGGASSSKKSSFLPSGIDNSTSGMPGVSSTTVTGKDGKKVTKFRYHKRITVRTSGKTSPAAIMDKVNKKDHNAGITPSTIEDMDPQELMRRAGIKGSNKTHWRVRLRQTKRLTKNGKTVTQTKVAYRDSEGNKRVKTSSSPYCKTCGKKLEECKCETNSQNSQNQ